MKSNQILPQKRQHTTGDICIFCGLGLLVCTMALVGGVFYATGEPLALTLGLGLVATALLWMLLLVWLLRRRLLCFTEGLCQALDTMMNGGDALGNTPEEETLFSRLHTRLRRLYEVMEKTKRRVETQRQELQSLVSDISHQVKTPVSNLKMLVDTLLKKPIPPAEQQLFLQDMGNQLDKLDFLFGAMVKSSRLETGMIALAPVCCRIYDTLAQALAGIVYKAEQKGISVAVDCPETLQIYHDSKWTAEALFNILDNAVKYTPPGGHIAIGVEQWEFYGKISIADTGPGIAEANHAAVFRRFYREEAVHNTEGLGLGLHLAREIMTRQGGYIKLVSTPGCGATFGVFLPNGPVKFPTL